MYAKDIEHWYNIRNDVDRQKRRKVANICDTRFHLAMHVAGDYIRTFGVKKGEYVAKYEKKSQ